MELGSRRAEDGQGHRAGSFAVEAAAPLAPRVVIVWPRRLANIIIRNIQAVLKCSCCTLLVVVIALAFSFASVRPTEYGLCYNRFTKTISSDIVYHGGRYFVGPLVNFLTFPATVQPLEFSSRVSADAAPLTTRSADGLAVTLHVSFQYKLIKQEVELLYRLVQTQHHALYLKSARDVLLRAAASHTASDYWTRRSEVGLDLLSKLNSTLQAQYAMCTGLQVLFIELPAQYEASITATQLAKRVAQTKYYEQQASLTRAKIKVMVADYKNSITVTLAKATAAAMATTRIAEANAAKLKIGVERKSLSIVQGGLALSSGGLVQYQRRFAYTMKTNATFMLGVPHPVAVMGIGRGRRHQQGPAPNAPLEACSAAAGLASPGHNV